MGFDVGMLRIIETFQQGTFADLFAAIADIRHPESCRTDFLDKVRAVVIALLAELAIYCRRSRAFLAAEPFLPAAEAVPTSIVGKPRITGGNFRKMLADFSGNRGRVLIQSATDFFKGSTFFQVFLKGQSFFIREKLRHGYSPFRRQRIQDIWRSNGV
jgi:hypothetical protein